MKRDYILLAAGSGKRLWPITEHSPKTMTRILEKPLLEWMIDAVLPNAEKVIVIVGAHKQVIIEHFKHMEYVDKLTFIEQREQKGTGHALLQAQNTVETEDVVVLNADTFSDPSLYSEIGKQGSHFIVGKKVEDGSRYGVLHEKSGKLIDIIEKPPVARNASINTGAYCVPKSFFKLLEELKLSTRGEYEVTDALTRFASKNELRVLPFEGYWNDVGYFWNLLDVNQYTLEHLMENKIHGNAEKGVEIDGKVFIGKKASVKGSSRIEGPVYIGDNCDVGPGAFLKNCVIESNCSIGNSEIAGSVLMNGTKAMRLNKISDSVVCENVDFEAGSQIANLRFDKQDDVTTEVDGKKVNSGRNKLGGAIGRDTKIGRNAVIYPGKLVGSHCSIYPNARIDRNVQSEEAAGEKSK